MQSKHLATVKKYYRLTKPGIIYGNSLMFVAGFFLASRNGVDWMLFFESLLGLSFIIGSACVFNNYADRDLDAKMERTKKRGIPSGRVSGRNALIFGTVLGSIGTLVLYYFTNGYALGAALAGFVVYVFLYTPLKRKTSLALYVGAVAGAMPPVVGYAAVANTFDVWALGLFIALFIWQLPHFIAIAVFRFEDYSAAGIPLTVRAPKTERERHWAKQIFFASLIVLLVGCLSIVLWRLLF